MGFLIPFGTWIANLNLTAVGCVETLCTFIVGLMFITTYGLSISAEDFQDYLFECQMDKKETTSKYLHYWDL